MNPIDAALSALSCVPCDERAFTVRALGFVADAELLKGALVMAILCGLWVRGREPGDPHGIRSRVVMTVAAGFAALCVSRLLAAALPFRPRPFEITGGDATVAYRALESWSAFPSDHAALFFALATGIAVLSRRLGALAVLHAIVVITLPRLYLGLHHPTDLLAGAAIGALCALAATREAVWRRCAPPVLAWSEGRFAPWFATLAFIVAFEIATLFDSVRSGARLLWPVVKPAVTTPWVAGELIAAVTLVGLVGLGYHGARRPPCRTRTTGTPSSTT
jgi:undecaprenyl-diphosphatase